MSYKHAFIELALKKQVLKFGEFTLKSGRQSPYFFNTGLFDSGGDLAALGKFYAQAIVDSGLEFDMIFGPAYKGIPLVAATGIALSDEHGKDLPYCFNRKEAKNHGEGGSLVGAPMAGRVLIIDDVISAGTAIRESIDIIRQAGATPAGVLIALDRQERGQGARSAIQEVETEYQLPVRSIINLDDLVEYLQNRQDLLNCFEQVQDYRSRYGIKN